jgi:hypothetical protein
MITHHEVLLYIAAFDLLVGTLIFRYLWIPSCGAKKWRFPVSWIAIISLVNLSGAFCGATIEEAVTGLGGLAMLVLILSAISSQEKLRQTGLTSR